MKNFRSDTPPQKKPEGSRKLVVLNNSCQVDQVIRGEWMTLKVLPQNGLPSGIYQLSEAQRPDANKDGNLKENIGQVLFSDSRSIFQLTNGKIIQHEKALIEESLKPDSPSLNIGSHVAISYINGRISAIKGIQESEVKQDQQLTKKTINHGHSL